MIYKTQRFISPTSIFNLRVPQYKGVVDVSKLTSALKHMNFLLEHIELILLYQPHREKFWEYMKDSRDLEEKKREEMLTYIRLYIEKRLNCIQIRHSRKQMKN